MSAVPAIDPSWHPLLTGRAPAWASAWGEDRHGVFAAFTVAGVTQRMRWIPGGQFRMGSPAGEPGRWDGEGPRHTVYISRGFWLFDTPCTQALWEAVMGANPSRFRDPERPVERVSWEDVQGFLSRIETLLPGLQLVLPTEAQWEYACRAGTGDALHTGPIEDLGPNNAPKGVGASRPHIDPDGQNDGAGRPDSFGYRLVSTSPAQSPGERLGYLGFRCARLQDGRSDQAGVRGSATERPTARPAMPAKGARPAAPPPGTPLDPSGTTALDLPDAAALILRTDHARLHLRRITRPAWASAMGRDRYGLWAEFGVESRAGGRVVQRLRWIPPGCFRMGSPDDEPGRWEAEGPAHRVEIARGFWLFDTPCTQAFWEAVTGENPSSFLDPERPVERVSWKDLKERFLPALDARCPGFALPTEAQWEHACRAGTETALYTGPIAILGDMDAPALDPIAWYGGNSGVDYDLAEGEDSTRGYWEGKRKQYPHARAGTRKVGLKAPNPWGLYDMLGNVWEWVEDAWYDDYEGAPADGSPWLSDAPGAARVVRGGSWRNLARRCRGASRSRYPPGNRLGGLGFRCARVQVS